VSRFTALYRWLPGVSLAGIVAGGVAWVAGAHGPADWSWAATTAIVLLPLVVSVAADLAHRRVGVDVIALLAMLGALVLGEYLAGAVIALMLSGGQALEQYAQGRARRELSSLLQRAPRTAHRRVDDSLETVPVDAVAIGDRLTVKPGETIPVDGVVMDEAAAVDESALTGEAGAVERLPGDAVRSGTVNAGRSLEMRATASAAESTYAGIVRLVQAAQADKAPFVRLADRYSLVFLAVTAAIAGAAWGISGDPVRALAVLVVATPCPLILAAPVAIVAGISRAAKRGVIVKGGGALEALATARVLLLDKTGTLTVGQPRVASIATFSTFDADAVLRLAASLEQLSNHVFAGPIVGAAKERGMRLEFPSRVEEAPGAGVRGHVGKHLVAVGRRHWVSGTPRLPAAVRRIARRAEVEGTSAAYVGVDGALVGAILLEDFIRPDTPRTLRSMRRSGITSVILVTGDHPAVAASVGEAIGADRVLSERSPAEKVDAVRLARQDGSTLMVGDGINDAAALAVSDVGVAMGARGASAASESADVVVLVDRLDRVAEAILIAKRARNIALQSVIGGMGLSVLAMFVAAWGGIVPVAGAVLQEVIDLAVIANALRALGGGLPQPVGGAAAEVGERFRAEHRALLPSIKRLQLVADRLDRVPGRETVDDLRDIATFLELELLPHEEAEGATLYPAVARLLGGEDPTAPMARAHLEISHLARRLVALVAELPPTRPGPEDVAELRRLLYSLHAILSLHFAQEDEAYMSLFEEPTRVSAA